MKKSERAEIILKKLNLLRRRSCMRDCGAHEVQPGCAAETATDQYQFRKFLGPKQKEIDL